MIKLIFELYEMLLNYSPINKSVSVLLAVNEKSSQIQQNLAIKQLTLNQFISVMAPFLIKEKQL